MDSFQLKIAENMLYNSKTLTIENFSTIASKLYTVNKRYKMYYVYKLYGTSGRHKRIGKVFRIKLKAFNIEPSVDPNIYTYITLLQHNGPMERMWRGSTSLPLSKPLTWDKDHG